MPRIKTYERQVGTPSATLRSGTSPQTAGAPGRALSGLGGAVTSFGDAIEKRRTQEDITTATEEMARLRNDYQGRLDEGLRTGDISAEKIQQDFEQDLGNIRSSLNTRSGLDFLDRRGAGLQSQILRSASQTQAQVAGKRAVEAWTNSINLNGNVLQSDPSSFQGILNETLESNQAHFDSGDISKENLDELNRKSGSELAKNAMRGWIRIDPSTAENLLKKGVFDEHLSSNDKDVLTNRIESLKKQRQNKSEKLGLMKFKNPWGFLKENGITPNEIDFNDPETILDRMELLSSAEKQFGYSKGSISFFNEREMLEFQNQLEGMNAQETTQLFSIMSQNIPEEQYLDVNNSLFQRNASYGVAMAIANDSFKDAETIVAGKKLLLEQQGGSGTGKSGIKTATSNEVITAFDATLGNAIQDPDLRIRLRDAAFSHYVKKSFDAGANLSVFDESKFKKSLEAISGPVVKVNDSRIMTFRDEEGEFVPEDELSDEFESLKAEAIKASQKDFPKILSGEDVDIDEAGDRINPVSVGDGKYILKLDNEFLLDKSGKPYEFDMKSYIKHRRKTTKGPGLFDRIFGD